MMRVLHNPRYAGAFTYGQRQDVLDRIGVSEGFLARSGPGPAANCACWTAGTA
jgi:hypothetical protein